MHTSHTRERSPKLEFNTKFLLTSWIMHRFQRFLIFWKADCLLFHLETTFLHCFVFVRPKTWHLWKVCLFYWTNAGFTIHFWKMWNPKSENSYRNIHNYAIRPECSKNSVHGLAAVQSTAPTDQNSQSMVWRKNLSRIARNKSSYGGSFAKSFWSFSVCVH